MSAGIFTVSLDFELFWGVRDAKSLESYRANLLGVRSVVPRLLECFALNGIKATWATVGMLFFDDREDLLANLPTEQPTYKDERLSPYPHLRFIGRNEAEDPFHFARSLIRKIQEYPGQEIASHTFSHFYCLEDGQTREQFRSDLKAAKLAAAGLGVELKSLVFPRNQINPEYLECCADEGFVTFRSNPKAWLYAPAKQPESSVRRVARLVDAYVPLVRTSSPLPASKIGKLLDVPASRFMRPYDSMFKNFGGLHVQRIVNEMTEAAVNGRGYHLWWHPHNFGVNREENLARFQCVASHYTSLAELYGMQSKSMIEVFA